MKQIIATITLIAFITIDGFGFLHAYQMVGNDHMDMSPCPFMQGHDVMCNMNALEHIRAWQAAFTTILLEYFLIFSVLTLSLYTLFNFKIFKKPDKSRLSFRRIDRYRRTPTIYELLFSDGILNPKAP